MGCTAMQCWTREEHLQNQQQRLESPTAGRAGVSRVRTSCGCWRQRLWRPQGSLAAGPTRRRWAPKRTAAAATPGALVPATDRSAAAAGSSPRPPPMGLLTRDESRNECTMLTRVLTGPCHGPRSSHDHVTDEGTSIISAVRLAEEPQQHIPEVGGSEASLRLLAALMAATLSDAGPSFRFSPPLAAVDAVAKPRRLTVLCCTEISAADLRKLRLVCRWK